MKRKFAALSTVALVSVFSITACAAAQEEIQKQAQEQVEKGRKQVEQKAQDVRQQVEKKVSKGQQQVKKQIEKNTQ